MCPQGVLGEHGGLVGNLKVSWESMVAKWLVYQSYFRLRGQCGGVGIHSHWHRVMSLSKTLTPKSTGLEVIKLFRVKTKIYPAYKC